MDFIFRTSNEELEIEEILNFITKHQSTHERYKKLNKYYRGYHDIIEKGGALEDRDNKIVSPYPKYITDFSTGFFMGNPIRYIATNQNGLEDDEFLSKYLEICSFNNEAKENLELAKTNSIKGESFEVLWFGEDKQIHFKRVQPDNAFLIYDSNLEEKEKFGVRYYLDGDFKRTITYIEVYDDKYIYYYNNENDLSIYDLIDIKEHPFGGVPLIHFKNNEELQGDFEQVISLIDSYNRIQTNTLNDMDEFSDSYLALVNYSATSEDDIKSMKKKKVLLLDQDGDAKWLTKEVNDTWVENYKNRLNKDIHKFSFTPDFTDEAFGTNLPGISLRLKLLTSEELRATKELFFRDGLLKRMDLIANCLSMGFDSKNIRDEIQIVFSDVLPQNLLELSQIILNLREDVSTETRLSLLPFIEDPSDEVEKKSNEDLMRAEEDLLMYKNLGINDAEKEE